MSPKVKSGRKLLQSDILSQVFGHIFDITLWFRTLLRTPDLFEHVQLVSDRDSNLGRRFFGGLQLVSGHRRDRRRFGRHRCRRRCFDDFSLKEFQVGRNFFEVVDGIERRHNWVTH